MEQTCTGSRKVYIDVLRIISTFLVLFIHTNNRGFAYFTVAQNSAGFPFYLFYSAFSKIAVPMFFMISGALLLKKEESLSIVLCKRFLRILLVLFSCSAVSYLLKTPSSDYSFKSFLETFYSSTVVAPYWYLYAFLGYLLMLPFLRKMSRLMKPMDYLYMTGIFLVISLLKILEFLVGGYKIHLSSNFSVFIVAIQVYYPLMGDFLANKVSLSDLTLKRLLAVVSAGLCALLLSCWLTCAWCEHIGEWKEQSCQTFINILVFIPVISVFLCARVLFSRCSLHPNSERIITAVGSCTFGIYLFEWFYRKETLFIFEWLNGFMPTFLACLLWITCAFALGLLVTIILKQIPGVKKLI